MAYRSGLQDSARQTREIGTFLANACALANSNQLRCSVPDARASLRLGLTYAACGGMEIERCRSGRSPTHDSCESMKPFCFLREPALRRSKRAGSILVLNRERKCNSRSSR